MNVMLSKHTTHCSLCLNRELPYRNQNDFDAHHIVR